MGQVFFHSTSHNDINACSSVEVKRGPLGRHQWDVHVGELLGNNFIIVGHWAGKT